MKSWCLVLLSMIMLSACAVKPLDMSQGASSKALVYSTQYTKKAPLIGRYSYLIELQSVDGVKASGSTGESFYVMPGEHTLVVKMISFDAPMQKIYAPVEVKFFAEGSKSYIIEAEDTKNLLARSVQKYKVVPYSGTGVPVVKLD